LFPTRRAEFAFKLANASRQAGNEQLRLRELLQVAGRIGARFEVVDVTANSGGQPVDCAGCRVAAGHGGDQ
jgi:hypothetical protein